MGMTDLKRVHLFLVFTAILCWYAVVAPTITDVRLVNGSNNAEGRVEVLYNGSWRTVCSTYGWDLLAARVVCRMLGFDGALEAVLGSARFGQGTGDILDVECWGTEDSLDDCSFGVANYCGHQRDAGAVCYSGAHPNPFQVRLVDGSNDAEGRVEVMYDGSWGTICDYKWDLRDARVVCRMLGFVGALNAPRSATFGQGTGRILLIAVGCDGIEENLADCAHSGIGDYSDYCDHGEDAGAVCHSGVRLTDGSDKAGGRVEILHDGSWGTICDDSWDMDDAEVVCRMLGFDGALDAPLEARFGKGSGAIFLDQVQCIGSESDLKRCEHAGIGEHDCTHNEDASVICIPTGDTKFSNILPQNLQLTIITGFCLLLLCIFLVATLAYWVRRVISSRARRKLVNDDNMDCNDPGLTQDMNADPTYQELNAPPNLSERRLTSMDNRTIEPRQNELFEDEGQICASGTKSGERHEYMETIPMIKRPSQDENVNYDLNILPDASALGPKLPFGNDHADTSAFARDLSRVSRVICDEYEKTEPSDVPGDVPNTEQNNIHQYMDMNTVYKKLAKEENEDLDGYLLPCEIGSKLEPLEPNGAKNTGGFTMAGDIAKSSTCDHGKQWEQVGIAEGDELSNLQENDDMNTVCKNLSKGNVVDLDRYLHSRNCGSKLEETPCSPNAGRAASTVMCHNNKTTSFEIVCLKGNVEEEQAGTLDEPVIKEDTTNDYIDRKQDYISQHFPTLEEVHRYGYSLPSATNLVSNNIEITDDRNGSQVYSYENVAWELSEPREPGMDTTDESSKNNIYDIAD